MIVLDPESMPQTIFKKKIDTPVSGFDMQLIPGQGQQNTILSKMILFTSVRPFTMSVVVFILCFPTIGFFEGIELILSR